jgi:hypothetical protein
VKKPLGGEKMSEIEKIEKIVESLKLAVIWADDLYVENKELYQKWKQERREKSFKLVKETEYYEIYTGENGLWVELKSKIYPIAMLYFVSF